MEDKTKNKGLSNSDIVKNRQKANKTIDGLNQLFGKKSFRIVGFGKNSVKVMSNEDRRKLGLEQDPDLEDYQIKE